METMRDFVEKLASKEPVPGGGGVSALLGALSAALCSMVANLTSGKKKYAQYQGDIDRIIEKMQKKMDDCLLLIEEDAKAFYPLSQAYSIPKDDPKREDYLEEALLTACKPPLMVLKSVAELTSYMSELLEKGTRLAISDVGVASTICRAAAESAGMNIFVNTKLMKDRAFAEDFNTEVEKIISTCIGECDSICENVYLNLR